MRIQVFLVKPGQLLFLPLSFPAGIQFLKAVFPHTNIQEVSLKIIKAVHTAINLRGHYRFFSSSIQTDNIGIKAPGLGIIPAAFRCLVRTSSSITAV